MCDGKCHYGLLESCLPISEWFDSVWGLLVDPMRMCILYWIGIAYTMHYLLWGCHQVELVLLMPWFVTYVTLLYYDRL